MEIIRLKIDSRYILTQPTFLTQLSTIVSKANTTSQTAKLSSGNEIFIQLIKETNRILIMNYIRASAMNPRLMETKNYLDIR
jgi:hypothetical protein